MSTDIDVEKLDDFRWLIPKKGKMRTEGLVYTDEKMLAEIRKDASLEQVANVACLPGIVGRSLAMPDIHWGYGFPIGGVAAFDMENGIVSPGGVGYDINCGVRLLRSDLDAAEIRDRIPTLVGALFRNIPSGVGSRRKDLKLSANKMDSVLAQGAGWAVSHGYGSQEDLEHIEEGGCIPGGKPEFVSQRARTRGKDQLGTLGSGNHFVEIGLVEEIYDETSARILSLRKGQVTVMVHTGSRGLGHQVCDDYIKVLLNASAKYKIDLPDKQLCCAPVASKESRQYLSAMACAANFAFCNRQLITHWVRETFQQVLQMGPGELGLDLVYDVCHNIAKVETHEVDGKAQKLCVHRKGATRALPPHSPFIPEDYKEAGQPVLIPGDMGRYSYVLVGTDTALRETFGSTCHGAGRLLSRHQAKKVAKGRAIIRELEDQGIYVQSAGKGTIKEEISEAYKDVADVVNVVHQAGIGKKVARLKPMGVIKG
ncbi:MAG: RNA-splicing ligase RtcB [Desulfobacterales bacterium C00003060]|nr:MAG: RNA-splicing ligase RtcB [Desulfobacterales bacterium S3730MH5]OEU79200.1 MAG: RNA-splicing ligase RtcB [Desulfobacterales bacterium S5133MH4]OEU79567.1 MAG: RNA-splicing ligase RtcB [Desulfobacterales bacterium C00003060]